MVELVDTTDLKSVERTLVSVRFRLSAPLQIHFAERFCFLLSHSSYHFSYATKEDTARVKFGLNKLGYYDEPEKTGMNTIPDEQMFDGIKDFQKDNGLQVDGYLKPFGETITAINNAIKQTPFYRKGYELGEKIAKNRHNLEEKQSEMYREKGDGNDNYYHRLAMCENAQGGSEDALISLGGGVLKEVRDIYCKTTGYCDRKTEPSVALLDSAKDMHNNIEGLYYGWRNPDKNCKTWLEDLDRKSNTWRNKR